MNTDPEKCEAIKSKKKIIRIPILGETVFSVANSVFGIFLGLFTGAILIAISGVNPLTAYSALLRGAFNNFYSFSNVLVRASPLLLGGVGVAIGIKSGIWNTGIEGYMYAGAIGATLIGIPNLGVISFIHILICLLAAAVFAAAWGMLPGYLRAYKGVNEVTSTIMMNYIAIYLTNWIVSNSSFADTSAYYPTSKPLSPAALLPIFIKGTSLHPGPFIGLAVCILLYFILKYTPFGFKTRMLGYNINAAKYAGINTKRHIVFIMVIGAMLGGISGAIEVIGLKHRLFMEFVTGLGYESVAVALVAGGNPIGVIISALFFSVLKVGGASMSIETGIGSSMTSVIIALCVLFVIGVGVADNNKTAVLKIAKIFLRKARSPAK